MGKAKVFLSYGAGDREWAGSFARALARRSVVVWFENDPGRTPDRADLIQALMTSDIYAVVIGKRGLGSPEVMFELGVAAASNRPVIPIILGDAATPRLLTSLARIHVVRSADPEAAAVELKRVVTQIKGE